MNDTIFSRLPFDPIYLIGGMVVLIVILFVLLISTMMQLSRLTTKYRSFMKGRDGASLEEAFSDRFAAVQEILDLVRGHEIAISEIRRSTRSYFQKVGIVRYDAFQEMGAKLSFALTLLDDKNNGFILNSMHSRDGCYTYIKEIVKGESFVALSEEEVTSLEKAITEANYLEA